MKRQYIKPSVRMHHVEIESSLLAAISRPPVSGVNKFLDETALPIEPAVLGGDYGAEKPEFIEGD